MKDIASSYWRKRYEKQGQNYVSLVGANNYDRKKRIISKAVAPHLAKGFSNALDFGAGVGRFQEMLTRNAEKVTALDWVFDALDALKIKFPSTEIARFESLPFELEPLSFDLVWSCMVLQHIVCPERFRNTACGLFDLAAPGATFLLIENRADNAPHVERRSAEDYAKALGVELIIAEPLTIDHPGSHWLIKGRREI